MSPQKFISIQGHPAEVFSVTLKYDNSIYVIYIIHDDTNGVVPNE